MDGYLTRKEAVEFLGKSVSYVDKHIASGEIRIIPDPKDGRKKLLLASDIYKIKEYDERAERKQDPWYIQENIIKELKLDILDMVAPYNIIAKELYSYEDEVRNIAKLSLEERGDALRELIQRIIEKHKDKEA